MVRTHVIIEENVGWKSKFLYQHFIPNEKVFFFSNLLKVRKIVRMACTKKRNRRNQEMAAAKSSRSHQESLVTCEHFTTWDGIRNPICLQKRRIKRRKKDTFNLERKNLPTLKINFHTKHLTPPFRRLEWFFSSRGLKKNSGKLSSHQVGLSLVLLK